MEKSGGKRNNKNQKNKQKTEETKTNVLSKDDSNKEPVTKMVKEPEPQPQRAIRRNQTEVKSVASEVASTQNVSGEKSEPKVEVDHSNLKRETEEIAKLTKKFSKREISSNWHRYSAPEKTDDDKAVEYEAPADFSDLIQISASRGGHLQLKEEQDWSSVSGAELGGYFALDLKMLNRGLACIPAHERLRIPSHVLTEDDMQKFNDDAIRATTNYNTEYSDVRSQTLKLFTSLVKNGDNCEQNVDYVLESTVTKESFNILDVETSTKKLLDLSLGPVTSFEESQKGNYVSENIVTKQCDLDISSQDDVALTFEEAKPPRKQSNGIKRFSDSNQSAPALQSHRNESAEKENISSLTAKSPNESKVKEGNSLNKQNVNDKNMFSKKEEPRKEAKPSDSTFNLEEVNQKILDDDDDLDFLLSLKAPIKSQKPVETSTIPVKEVSILPIGTKVVPPTTNTTNLDLDDWLDSVLQD